MSQHSSWILSKQIGRVYFGKLMTLLLAFRGWILSKTTSNERLYLKLSSNVRDVMWGRTTNNSSYLKHKNSTAIPLYRHKNISVLLSSSVYRDEFLVCTYCAFLWDSGWGERGKYNWLIYSFTSVCRMIKQHVFNEFQIVCKGK